MRRPQGDDEQRAQQHPHPPQARGPDPPHALGIQNPQQVGLNQRDEAQRRVSQSPGLDRRPVLSVPRFFPGRLPVPVSSLPEGRGQFLRRKGDLLQA